MWLDYRPMQARLCVGVWGSSLKLVRCATGRFNRSIDTSGKVQYRFDVEMKKPGSRRVFSHLEGFT